MFVLSAPGWGRRRVRVPVTDFFVGSSQVAQRDYAISKELWNTIDPLIKYDQFGNETKKVRPVPKSHQKDTKVVRKTAVNSRRSTKIVL